MRPQPRGTAQRVQCLLSLFLMSSQAANFPTINRQSERPNPVNQPNSLQIHQQSNRPANKVTDLRTFEPGNQPNRFTDPRGREPITRSADRPTHTQKKITIETHVYSAALELRLILL
jgi:hypothetical protein